MSLHYLVKLEILIGHVLRLSCYRKKLKNLFHRNCGPQISQLIRLQHVGLLQEKVYKIRITDLDELKQRLMRTEWAKLGHVFIATAIRHYRR